MSRRLVLSLICLQLILAVGCSNPPPKPKDQKETFPVSGIVHIDGKPVAGVQVFAYPADNPPGGQSTPTTGALHNGVTDAEGKFKMATYNPGDGVPEGSYVVSFYWDGGVSPMLERSGDDERKVPPAAAKFNKKYGTPTKSKTTFTVEKGKPTDLGTLELTAK